MIKELALALIAGILSAYYCGTVVPVWAVVLSLVLSVAGILLINRMRICGVGAALLFSFSMGFAVMKADMQSGRSDAFGMPRTVEAAMTVQRQALLQRFRNGDQLGDDEYAVVAAMTLGDKRHVHGGLKRIYSISGAAHVFALSGMHVGILYGLLMLLLPSRIYPRIFAFVSVAAIWGFVFLVGLHASLMRAAVMVSVFSCCRLLRRRTDSLSKLALAITILLLLRPSWLFDIGFQMSFAAVLGITMLYTPICLLIHFPSPNALLSPWLRAVYWVEQWLWNISVLSFCAQLFVLPLLAHYFGRLSVYSMLSNLVVSPLATFVIAFAIMVLVLSSLSAVLPFMAVLTKCAAWALYHTTHLMNTALANISALPGSHIDGLRINEWQTVCLYAIVGIAISLVRKVCRQAA